MNPAEVSRMQCGSRKMCFLGLRSNALLWNKLFFKKVIINNVSLGEYVHAEIIINGIPFAEITEKHERLAAEKGTGDYKGLQYIYDLAHCLYDALANNTTRYDEDETQIPLMICNGCQEPGCSGLWVTIEETDHGVVWHDIKNRAMAARRPGKTRWWIYDEFPDFCFDKTEYTAALDELKVIALAAEEHMLERRKQCEARRVASKIPERNSV